MTVLDASDAARVMMKSLGMVGRYDVRWQGSRSTGYVGKPGEGEDVEFVVTINKLPPLQA